ncbi:MAG: cytochrome c oxidase accessory protein CcoG [Pseudomonadota bacterium]
MVDIYGNADAQSRQEQKHESLYQNRVKVYPKKVAGTFRRLKWTVLIVLLGIYYIAPWIRWDRGPNAPDQAFLIDMPHRRAYFLWIEIWPQEIYYLAGILLLGAVGLIFVTSLFGRVWCGYTCPQTVWTDLFMWVERLIEGDRTKRMRFDKAPASSSKLTKKAAKHGVWLIIAALTGGAWIMYFNDAPTVVVNILTGQASLKVYGFFALFTATTYLLAGWAREQVCVYMCPWPRFQSAMFDEDTMIVTYESWRGEPRGKHKKGTSWEGRGHCVDCKQCVAACPTGIDIRDGVQLECIGCALCIDACNEIMGRLDLPRGLISYDTDRNLANKAEGKPLRYRLIRPRTIIYSVLLVVVATVMVWSLATRAQVDINVLHDRNPLFVTLSDGSIRNGYTIKILNMTREEKAYKLAFEGLGYAEMTVVGQEDSASQNIARLTAGSDTVATYRVFMVVPADLVQGEVQDFNFVLTELQSSETVRRGTVFRGP